MITTEKIYTLFICVFAAQFPLFLLSFPCSEYFVINLSTNEDDDVTTSVLDPELDRTEYHEETIHLQEGQGASTVAEPSLKRELELANKPKVITTVDKLRELIPSVCKVCAEVVCVNEKMSGAVMVIQWNCSNGHSNCWNSSEVLTVKNNQKVYVNNIQLSAAILLSGNNFGKVELFAKFLNLQSISESVFYRIQKLYCFPAIQKMWNDVKKCCSWLFVQLRGHNCRRWEK